MTLTELIPEITKLDRSDKIRAIQVIAEQLVKEDPPGTGLRNNGNHPVIETDEHKLSDATERAIAFYASDLAALLEPDHKGEDVAIHIDTKSYEVARGTGHAYRALRAKQPEGFIVVHKIGVADSGLASRMKGERYL